MILSAEQPFLIPDAAPPPPPTGGITPRPYQDEGLVAARRIIAEGVKRILLVLATGGGKTVIAALVALGALLKGKRVLFVGPRREIISQAFWKLIEAGIPELSVGVIMADGIIPHATTRQPYDARRPHAPVQVASVQTLAQRKNPPPADVVFIDEAHHATSETWAKTIAHYTEAGAVVVGLTATPCRADGAGLGKWFDRMHVIAGFSDLAAQGFLVEPRVFTTPNAPDLSKVKLTRAGEYDSEQLATAMRTKALVGDVVEHWQRHAEGRTTVVFAASVEHSRELRDAFRAAGVPADHIDAGTDRDERDAALSRLARGETTVLCNMGVCTEGWDLPRCKCVVLARPTKSLSLFLQMAGRGLRPWEGVSAILLDHAGAVHEHGLPSDEREWSLDGKVRRKKAVAIRTCPKCYAALPAATRVCTECGHVFPVEEREGPEAVDGELVEATAKPKPTMDERATWYAQALSDAASRGRKVGFARHRFKEYFGGWPRGPRLAALEREHYPRVAPEPPPPAEAAPAAVAWSIDLEAEALTPAQRTANPWLAEVADMIAAPTPEPAAPPPPPAPSRARRIDLAALVAAAPPPPPEPVMEAWTL